MQQLWERSFDHVEPGHWKKQLPTKVLAVTDIAGLRKTLKEHPEYLNKRGNHGRTLLWEATRKGKVSSAAFLLDRGADPGIPGGYNSESYVQLSPYCAAVYYRRLKAAELLRDTPQDVFRAAFLGDRKRVENLLTPDLVNALDPFDEIYYTPLITFAVAGGQADLTAYLTARGADVRPFAAQLLFAASRLGRLDLLRLLVEKGAHPSLADARILVAIHDMDCFEFLLAHGAPTRGALPYICRADKGERADKVRLLIEAGADLNEQGPRGQSALQLARHADFKKVVALLVKAGAKEAPVLPRRRATRR